MAFSLSTFGSKTEWTALETAADGRLLGVKVHAPGRGGVRPIVKKCAVSSPVAMGEQALAEIAQQLGTSQWTCPLPRGDYQMLVMPEPPVLESEMESSLRWSLASLVDYPVEEAVVAWMRIPTAQYQPTREKQLYVIVARQSVVDEQAALFAKAKVALKAVDVRETALRNISALIEKKDEGLGLLTVADDGVTTTFTFNGELYLDRFIAQPLRDLMEGDDSRQQRFFERVAQQVQQSMDLIARNYPFIDIGRIVVAPLPVPLALAETLNNRLQVQVDLLDIGSIFDISAAPLLKKPENQARYLVALGAALRGARLGAA